MNKHRILCVDDEVDNVDALERVFRKKFTVLKATSGKEALKILDQDPGPIAVIITDQRMPEMTGVEFLESSFKYQPKAVRILLTGYTDIESIVSAINKGQIFRYLTKPWDSIDLANTVDRAVDHYNIGIELDKKNQALELALKELSALDKAKADFMILVNHELKTPITSILSFLELLKESKLDEDQTLMVDRALKNTDRLRLLTEDVLLLLRAENGQIEVHLEGTTVQSLCEDLPEAFKKLLNQKQCTVRLSGPRTPVLADPRLLQQILYRLLHNSIKFCSAQTEILLEVSEFSGKIKISIENYGSQISNQAIEKIFKPFILNENVMNHSTGLGIGLTISQSLLLILNSTLNIQNTSKGVIVFFELPIFGH